MVVDLWHRRITRSHPFAHALRSLRAYRARHRQAVERAVAIRAKQHHRRCRVALKRVNTAVNATGRPFVHQGSFEKVWRMHRAFALQKYADDYTLWINSYHRQLRKLLSNRLKEGAYKVFAKATAVVEDTRQKATLHMGAPERDDYRSKRQYDHAYRVWSKRQMSEFANTEDEWLAIDENGTLTKRFRLNINVFEDNAAQRRAHTIASQADVRKALTELPTKYIEKLEAMEYIKFVKGEWLQAELATYVPLTGAAHATLPAYITNKKAIVNVQNKDERCFEYAVLSALHPQIKHADRPNKYSEWIGSQLDFTGMSQPMKLDGNAIKRFEARNAAVLKSHGFEGINVYSLRDEQATVNEQSFRSLLMPVYISDARGDVINLFYYAEHYTWIKNWQRFTNANGQHHHHCPRCLQSFKSTENLEAHLTDCQRHEPMNTKMPQEGAELRFSNWNRTLRHPVAVYADFEALSVPLAQDGPKDAKSTQPTASFGRYIVADARVDLEPYCQYVGDRVHQEFISELRGIEQIVREQVFSDKEMNPLTEEEQHAFDATHCCPVCEVSFDAKRWDAEQKECVPVVKVRDHSHRTGRFRGAMCDRCNLRVGKQEQHDRFIPVFFHNLKGYDMHHVLQCLAEGDLDGEQLSVIPQNGEKFTAFTWKPRPCSKTRYNELQVELARSTDKERKKEIQKYLNSGLQIRFLDSAAFMASSLMSLLENLPDDKKILLKELSAGSSTRFELIKRKGGFPYEWFDSFEKLQNTMLPVADDWSSRLTRSWISEKQLADYQEVWDAFEMRTFKDWHDLYLEIDVRGLTDVFEAFREMCLCTYSLDPCHYYTAPGLFNDAAYKYTKAEVELLSDIDMHNMFEKGIRGGLSVQTHRYSKARHGFLSRDTVLRRNEITQYVLTHPRITKVDKALRLSAAMAIARVLTEKGCANDWELEQLVRELQETPGMTQGKWATIHNIYLDANNLYGWAMKQKLPIRCFAWLNQITIDDVLSLETEETQRILRLKLIHEKYSGMLLDAEGTKHHAKTFAEIVKDTRYCESLMEKCADSYKYRHLIRYLREREALNENLTVGLVLEVDLDYPTELHDKHNDYPLAPESKTICESEISEYSKEALGERRFAGGTKLCATLEPKRKYVVHARNLKFYIEEGLVVTKIHRAVGFLEGTWLKPYIELNEGRRSAAKNDFEKDFFKLANNAVFGKQMENVRKRYKPLKFVTSEHQFIKEVAKPSYIGNVIQYSNSMISLCHAKMNVLLNKPIQVGFAILDLSKLCMFQFHYRVMLPFYGPERLKLLFTDTDSLAYQIKTVDVYADMAHPKLNSHFDFSNYDKDHPLFNKDNKKVAGFFKDENGGVSLVEFAGLRSKMYAVSTLEVGSKERMYFEPRTGKRQRVIIAVNEKVTCKGVKKLIAQTHLTMEKYKSCLFEGASEKVSIPSLISKKHHIFLQDRLKTSLSRYDDKRFILPDGVNTLAYGHRR